MMMARFFQPSCELGLTPLTRAILKEKARKEKDGVIPDALSRHEKKREKAYE